MEIGEESGETGGTLRFLFTSLSPRPCASRPDLSWMQRVSWSSGEGFLH